MTLGRPLDPRIEAPQQTSPIDRIPEEVLREIFLHIVSTTIPPVPWSVAWKKGSFTDSTRVVPLLRVSRKWRQTALSCQRLFGTVWMDGGCGENLGVMMQLMDCVASQVVLIRHRGAPRTDTTNCWVALALALRQREGHGGALRSSRLRILKGDLENVSFAALWEIIKPASKSLLHLDIAYPRRRSGPVSIPLDLPSFSFTALQHITLRNVRLEVHTSLQGLLVLVPSLKSLYLNGTYPASSVIEKTGHDHPEEWIVHPCLETVVVSGVDPKVVMSPRKLRLPCLKHLCLIGTRKHTYEAFEELLSPSNKDSSIEKLQTLVLAIDLEKELIHDVEDDTTALPSGVEEDHFGSTDIWDKIAIDIVKTLEKTPSLRELGLVGLQDTHGLLVEALTPPGSRTKTPIQGREVFLPALVHLDLCSPVKPYTLGDLKMMLDRRRDLDVQTRAVLRTFNMQDSRLGEGNAEHLEDRGADLRSRQEDESSLDVSRTSQRAWIEECSRWKKGWITRWLGK